MIIGYSGPYRVTLQDQRKALRHAGLGLGEQEAL